MATGVLRKEGIQSIWMNIKEPVMLPFPTSVADGFVFEEVFKTHFRKLHAYAYTMVKESMAAEELVQNVFFKLWEKKEKLTIQTSISAYLYKSVYNESLNYLKHQKVKAAYQEHNARINKNSADYASGKVMLSELEQEVDKALKELPEQCRTIFQMSRFEDLKYQEIAHKLGISIKTVENQMGKALKLLRIKLANYLPFLFVLISLP